jgi:hypothetical protein
MVMLRGQQHGQPAAMMVAAGVFGVFGVCGVLHIHVFGVLCMLGAFHIHVTHMIDMTGVSRMVFAISMRVRFLAARAAVMVIVSAVAASGLVVIMYRVNGNFGSIVGIGWIVL